MLLLVAVLPRCLLLTAALGRLLPLAVLVLRVCGVPAVPGEQVWWSCLPRWLPGAQGHHHHHHHHQHHRRRRRQQQPLLLLLLPHMQPSTTAAAVCSQWNQPGMPWQLLLLLAVVRLWL
jgi:hypothetical protein